jgi:hypothetical protein
MLPAGERVGVRLRCKQPQMRRRMRILQAKIQCLLILLMPLALV